jgi:glycosyltransferase involved in cell wall biosynthesis
LVYPSLYEGFGLPILEAYACELPVVTSDMGSMKEIGNFAAQLVNPKSTLSIESGIIEVLKDKEKYIKRGCEMLKKYSWEQTGRETLKVYNNLLKR